MLHPPLFVLAASLLLGAGCKVPISEINAHFTIADTSWFAEEETLFLFYEMSAEQGLGDESLLEIRYTTDTESLAWTKLADLPQVHTHLSVDCGFKSRCGSGSLHLALEPRDVGLRLRYHKEGEISLEAKTLLNIIGPGAAHSHRSLLLYGVFDERNRAVQWRARHRFPTIRNEEAQRLGLRRHFSIESQVFGSRRLKTQRNPYAYGLDCSLRSTPLEWEKLESDERAIFNPLDLPSAAAEAEMVCAQGEVYDPAGSFSTTVVARKNPEVRPAFPLMRSPVRDATPVKFLLSVCERSISSKHLAMQRQRLFMDGLSPICIDNWMNGSFAEELLTRLREKIEQVRAEGDDMVLLIALHHDTPALRRLVEEVLSETLATERDRSTPRVAGAFLLDSFSHRIADARLGLTTIWCPTTLPEEEPEDLLESAGNSSSLACAILLDDPSLSLGPFSVGILPIFPTRSIYLDFIDKYSEAQAGRMNSLTFRVPELPPSAEHLFLDPVGVVTFMNGELITAKPEDAFSFCEGDEYFGFLFRSPKTDKLQPLSMLPEWHEREAEESYQLGITWDFPFLMRLEYEAVGALAVSAFSASLPFGISRESEENYGSTLWLSEEFSLAETLTQCRRFCDHPSFDSAGIYQVSHDFRSAYQLGCYQPKYPQRGDSGFPDDP